MPEPVTVIGFMAGVAAVGGHLARRYFEVAKECLDILLGFVGLVLAVPLLLVCAAVIKLSSRGPVFYAQDRVGKDGLLFRMYKLRTMHVGAESADGPVWASADDPRVIRSCRWMRLSHVDELPQLVNVIRGEMSLVGPRPERPEILSELERSYPNVKARLSVRPGITGLAQVKTGYDTSVEQFHGKLAADLEYIEKRRWITELWIMVKTLTKIRDKAAH